MPDYSDMNPFDRWWATKGWWLGRQMKLDEATIKKIWEEGYYEGANRPRHRDGRFKRYENMGYLRGEY